MVGIFPGDPKTLTLVVFMEKVKKGEAHMPGSGFGGKGLERIEKEREMLKQSQKAVCVDDG